MHPCRQGEVDLFVKHHGFAFGCGESDCCGMGASVGSQRPALHEQLLISRNPHTPTRPSFAHCDCTAAGSTGLSLLTQAGIAPQQLPTFLTAQSLSALQPYSIVGASRRSDEHTSELQSLMRISYAVFCLKKKNKQK